VVARYIKIIDWVMVKMINDNDFDLKWLTDQRLFYRARSERRRLLEIKMIDRVMEKAKNDLRVSVLA